MLVSNNTSKYDACYMGTNRQQLNISHDSQKTKFRAFHGLSENAFTSLKHLQVTQKCNITQVSIK